MYLSDGLIIGYNRIPVQKEILNIMKKQGFEPGYIEKWLDANKHNHATTTYYLYHKKLKLNNELEIVEETKSSEKKALKQLMDDPAANIIEEFLVDDMSEDSFLMPDKSKEETMYDQDKLTEVYKAISKNIERSRLANNRQFKSENVEGIQT